MSGAPPRLRATPAAVAVLVGAHLALGAHALRIGLVDDARAAWLAPRSEGVRVVLGGRAHDLVEAGGLWRLGSTLLVHVDAFHLFVNALGLGLVGRVVEPWLGPWRTAAVLVGGGLGGAVLSQVSGIPRSDGASGAAFALVGAGLAVGLRRPDVPRRERRVLVRVLGSLAAINVALSLLLPSLDAAAHTGGLLVGLLLAAPALPRVPDRAWVLLPLSWALVVGLGYAGRLGP